MSRCLSFFSFAAISLCGLVSLPSPSQSQADYFAEKIPRRLALVIGNFDYTNLTDLPGVKADLESMTASFKALGFDEVVTVPNVPTWDDFQYNVLKPFKAKVQRDDLVVVYFSGHGFSYAGYQYFAPTEMKKTISAGKVAYTAIPVETLPEVFHDEGAGAALIIVDACRTIGDFIVQDRAGNAVSKGPNDGGRKSLSTNYILALSVGSGLPSQASLDPTKMSVYTHALSSLIGAEADKDFRDWHDDVEYEVSDQTNDAQVPGLHEFTMTDIVLRMSDDWRVGEKRRWEAVVTSNDYAKVKKFARKYTLNPYIEDARRWLSDHEEAASLNRTSVSPVGIDFAWNAEAKVEGISSVINFPQEVNYQQYVGEQSASLSTYGVRLDDGAVNPTPQQLEQWAKYVAKAEGVRAEKRIDINAMPEKNSVLVAQALPTDEFVTNARTFNEPPGLKEIKDVVQVTTFQNVCIWPVCVNMPVNTLEERTTSVPDPDWIPTTWVEVTREGKDIGWLPLDGNNSQFNVSIGKAFEEVVTGQLKGAPSGLIDDTKINAAFKQAVDTGTQISWASIAAPAMTDDGDEDILVATTMRSLEINGLSRNRMTAVYGDPTVKVGELRVRLFAQ